MYINIGSVPAETAGSQSMVSSQLEAFSSKVKYLHSIKLKIKAFAEGNLLTGVYGKYKREFSFPAHRGRFLGCLLHPMNSWTAEKQTDYRPGNSPLTFQRVLCTGWTERQ